MSKPSYITKNFSNNNYLYQDNIRKLDLDYGINFSPAKMTSNFQNYDKVAYLNHNDDTIVYKTSGTQDSKGSKQNSYSVLRPDIDFNQVDSPNNKYYWNQQFNPNLDIPYTNDNDYVLEIKQGFEELTTLDSETQLFLDSQFGPDIRFLNETTPDFLLRIKSKYHKITGPSLDSTNINDWSNYVGPSNILPESHPATVPIFEDGQSCKTQDYYHKPNVINLPIINQNNKPKYGSQQALPKHHLLGPRLFSENHINTNTKKPFDIKNSGYNVSIKESFQDRPIIDNSQSKTIPSYSDLKKQNKFCSLLDPYECKSDVTDYNNKNSVYDLPCGTKNVYGSTLEKNNIKPNLSKFVMHNIIGLNTTDLNQPIISLRNYSMFNNSNDEERSLNDIKMMSNENYIRNTNQLRLEANKNLQTQTEKLQLNLSSRG